jgi:ATP-dependent RNA helicase RhlB
MGFFFTYQDLYIGNRLLKTLFKKIKNLFSRKKKGAIPFAERSREAVKDIPFQEDGSKTYPSNGRKPKREDRTQRPPRTQQDKSNRQDNIQKDRQRQDRPPRKEAWKDNTWKPDDFKVPELEGKIRFQDLDLPPQILHAIADLNYQYCTPVQAGILPSALKGKDAIGKAQTGTGKSAAFLISIFTHMLRNPIKGGPSKGYPRALILAPTRELVLQIEKDAIGLCKYTPFKIISVFGGMGYEKQMQNLKDRSFDVIVATPGRLIDFQNKKLIRLDKVEILVLDEADRMLDMGFIPDVRKIVYSTPNKTKRQTFFYSATFTPEVNRLAEQWTTDPCKVEIEPDQVAAENVKQVVYITTNSEKFPLLYNLIISNNLERVLVFTNRRDQARDLAKKLLNYGISTSLISGEVQQNKRIKALEGFRGGNCRVLVATDVAARGIHIEDISHVINYHLPEDPENYVHRIGRTGRAGSSGTSVSFASEDDSFQIPDIEAFLGNDLVCEHPDDALLVIPPVPALEQEDLDAKKEWIKTHRNKPRPRKPGGSGSRDGRQGSRTKDNSSERSDQTGQKNSRPSRPKKIGSTTERTSANPHEKEGEKKERPKHNRFRGRHQKPPHREPAGDEP